MKTSNIIITYSELRNFYILTLRFF